MGNEIILRKIESLGITEPLTPTAEAIKTVIGAYLTRKTIDGSTFRGYIELVNPSLYVLMAGLRAFSLDQTGVSHKVQGMVQLAIEALTARLARPEITPREAGEIRLTILDLVREARDEANDQRILTVGLAAFATTAFVALMGGALTMLEHKRSNDRLLLR